MILYVSHHFFAYEAGNLFRLFFPYAHLRICQQEEPEITARAVYTPNMVSFTAQLDGETLHKETPLTDSADLEQAEYAMVRTIFQLFQAYTGYTPQWGMLTGIHPVKLFTKKVAAVGLAEACAFFQESYFVSRDKIDLCVRILEAQRPSLSALEQQDFSLYVSIPFCPSRCSYCSFVSQSVEKSQKLIAPYVALLLQELADTAQLVRAVGLRLVSVYVGGGTPTTLSAQQLSALITTIQQHFDLRACKEFTVEAGRPDTLDQEKLEILRKCGVDRISINPQSLQDAVLVAAQRKHTAADVVHTYHLARQVGHQNINMDLIAGLQADTAQSFADTIEKVLALQPENITVHTLALKRSATIFHSAALAGYHKDTQQVVQMVDYATHRLTQSGYKPYYLYRQSRMAGNLENTGWAKSGKACAYNIYTMDESQTVIACGAGGVSKIIDPYSDRLERIFNFKYAHEYIDRFSEILERKKEVTKLYGQFRQRVHQIHQPSRAD